MLENKNMTEQKGELNSLLHSEITLPYSYGVQGWNSPVEWLIQDYIPAGKVGMLIGESQDGKTFLSLQMAASIATGQYFGKQSTKKGLVIYVAGESPGSVSRRLKAIEIKNNIGIGNSIIVVNRALSPTCYEDRAELEALISLESERQKLPPALLIFDTFSQCAAGIEENSAKDVSYYMRSCTEIAEKFGISVLNVHHLNKEGGYRGSSALIGNIDFALQTKKLRDKDRIATKLSVFKAKDSCSQVAHEFEMEVIDIGLTDNLGQPVTSLVVSDVKPTYAGPTIPQAESDALLIVDIIKQANDWVPRSVLMDEMKKLLPSAKEGSMNKRVSNACTYLKNLGKLKDKQEGKTKDFRLINNESMN